MRFRQGFSGIIARGFCLFLSACSSSDVVVAGRVFLRDGSQAKQILVRIVARDDRGQEITELGKTLTDDRGEYNYRLPVAPGNAVFVQAHVGDAPLWAFAFSRLDGESCIHPLTNALVESAIDMTTPHGGLTLGDFSKSQLLAVTKAAMALDTEGTDLSDTQAVSALLLTHLGRFIAQASGSVISVSGSAGLDPAGKLSTPVFGVGGYCHSALVHELASNSFIFDLTAAGEICTGYTPFIMNAFAMAFVASALSDTFVGNDENEFPSQEATATLMDTRTLVLGPAPLHSGVTWTRKVFVSAFQDIARYLEILHNPTSSPQSLTLQWKGFMGADVNATVAVRGLDSASLVPQDRFAAVVDTTQRTPSVGFVWQDNNGTSLSHLGFPGFGGAGAFQLGWADIGLAPGQTKAFLIYALITAEHNPDALRQALVELVESPDMSEMSTTELMALENFAPHRGNVVGPAGSIVAGSTVTVINKTSGKTVTTKARSDWGFYVAIASSTGDLVSISASDGYLQDFVVP